ncbi:MAG: hypothetical protein H6741_10515 [Alphaproteobacteria bacterium]|nr:hypothetical protein [Alphaproteobacteria bacterium]
MRLAPRLLAAFALSGLSVALATEASPVLSPELDGAAQLVVERLNAIRADPSAQLDRFELSLAMDMYAWPERCAPEPELLLEVLDAEPRPPLAPTATLSQVAEAHARDMVERRFYGHVSPEGVGPNARLRAAGLSLDRVIQAEGRSWRYGSARGSNQVEALEVDVQYAQGEAWALPDETLGDAVDALILDRCKPERGHRVHLLGLNPLTAGDREIGVGVASAVGPRPEDPGWEEWRRALVLLTLNPSHETRYLLGVLYEDRDGDGAYSLGEGLGGERVEALGTWTTTASGGGYVLPVPAGAQGELLALGQRLPFQVGEDNVKLDLRR